jgi:hypothetical protein
MFGKASLEELQETLASTEAAIASHPLASEPVKQANAVIETTKAEGNEAVDRDLAARGLPDLETLGRITVQGSTSWWKLHRDRKLLLRKIDRYTR